MGEGGEGQGSGKKGGYAEMTFLEHCVVLSPAGVGPLASAS
jgi:hypothetical protein